VRGRTQSGPGRSIVALVLGFATSVALSACAPGQGPECGGAGGCAAIVSVPTSDVAAHDDGRGLGIEGILGAMVRDGQVCLKLDRGSAAPSVNLLLPAGTRATPLGELPTTGEVHLRLLGEAGIGGIRTGDHVRVTPDRGPAIVAVTGCGAGFTMNVRWMATTAEAAS
jgi:hypothetical protein